ncbi:hypothetical protein GX50_02542 [[Emmonsia] crescens]|uniref:Protein kinase domain-containing protein n=1 Tax=[Emmonsia] crescens TaxID=73230 RepID=A0A2B7ZNR3_9EURO|nr:hypothetical protein GX50_02542 [Emmonsia crescens]
MVQPRLYGFVVISSKLTTYNYTSEPRYVVLKIYILSSRAGREITVYKHLDSIGSDHAGKRCLRMLLDSFEVSGPHGSHICLVHKPLGLSLQEFRSLVPEGVFNMQLLQPTLRQIFAALDYLHTDESIFLKYEEAEFEEPVPRKITNDRTIYTSRPLPITFGVPVLCDLGEARFGNEDNNEDIMPDVYRAPEAWDLFEHNRIFSARNPDGKLDDAYHLAEMIAVLGPPPLEFLRRSEKSLKFWDENGNWRGLAPIPENRSLEELEQRLEGEDKRRFLQYLRRMLYWVPEERPVS